MLVVKIFDETDLMNQSVTRLEVKPSWEPQIKIGKFLREIGFIYDRVSKSFSKTFLKTKLSHNQIKSVINYLISQEKYYRLDHYKFIKRKYSKNMNNTLKKIVC